jgi:hypothetical protein
MAAGEAPAGTVQFNTRMDPTLRGRFRRACAAGGRSAQDVIAELVGEWLDRADAGPGNGTSPVVADVSP